MSVSAASGLSSAQQKSSVAVVNTDPDRCFWGGSSPRNKVFWRGGVMVVGAVLELGSRKERVRVKGRENGRGTGATLGSEEICTTNWCQQETQQV